MKSLTDHADILARPPLIYAGALALVLLLRWQWPTPLSDRLMVQAIGALLVALGLALGIPGRWALSVARTNVNPMRPTTAVVQTSSYGLSRHPLYVGLAAVFLGISLLCSTPWGFVVFVPLALVMHFGVILPEERYLERKFGDVYRQYCARVRRYL